MIKRNCFVISLLLVVGIGYPSWSQEQNKEKAAMTANAQPIRPLADDFVAVYASPDPQRVFAYSPGIVRLDSGRLVATIDIGGPGVKDWPGVTWARPERGDYWQGRVYTSDDRGKTWTQRVAFPFMHARPFTLTLIHIFLNNSR